MHSGFYTNQYCEAVTFFNGKLKQTTLNSPSFWLLKASSTDLNSAPLFYWPFGFQALACGVDTVMSKSLFWGQHAEIPHSEIFFFNMWYNGDKKGLLCMWQRR